MGMKSEAVAVLKPLSLLYLGNVGFPLSLVLKFHNTLCRPVFIDLPAPCWALFTPETYFRFWEIFLNHVFD